jgi:hypothetical protein
VEYVPVAQSTHTAEEDAPAVTEYFPATQFTHASAELAPASTEYVPATQLTHVALLTFVYCPAGQLEHALAPAGEFLPASQVKQLLTSSLPTLAEYFPTAQFKQWPEEFPPNARLLPYEPAGQSVQAFAPISGLYFPARHSEQLSHPWI